MADFICKNIYRMQLTFIYYFFKLNSSDVVVIGWEILRQFENIDFLLQKFKPMLFS